ncbi:PadR family transcriptional regulator [Aestuariivirga sp.]|uniref:PadR family transcriptional regulator n=1 Tax=Aestuariivirga sp. TaxID=2650926 RepID=UPI0039E391A4
MFGHFGKRRGSRMFDSGDLRLIVLGLIAEQSRHGYDIIRALKHRFRGAYSPSPGSIYPMMQMLEEQGLIAPRDIDGRRVFDITEAGLNHLSERAAELARIQEQVDRSAGPRDDSDLGREMSAFRHTLFHRMREGGMTEEQSRKLGAILKTAREAIEKL